MTNPSCIEAPLPKGVSDFLPETSDKITFIAARIHRVFELWGFRRVITPLLEFEGVLALGMGATRIFALARNKALLERVRLLAPERICVHSVDDGPFGDWVRAGTDGLGADIFIDAIGPGAGNAISLAGVDSLRRGGRMVSIGGMAEPLPLEMFRLMCFQISVIGSLWFDTGEGQDMAEMAAAGTLDLSVFEHQRFPLDQIDQALAAIDKRSGGFTNVVIVHD